MADFIRSSRNNPCPICGRTKDQDCSMTKDENLVCCHTYQDQAPENLDKNYVYRGQREIWGMFFKVDKNHEKIRSVTSGNIERQTSYIYRDIAGHEIAQVVRIDKPTEKKFYQQHFDGQAWVNGLPQEVRENLRLYRIDDSINQEAIASQEYLLLVEGEKCVDFLLKRGISATCSIGGAGKWRKYGYPNYLEDLRGANVVLCPDMDISGLEHCLDIEKDFPQAKWLYAFPESPVWSMLPAKEGLDIYDWIMHENLSRDDILAAVTDKKTIDFDFAKLKREIQEKPLAIKGSDLTEADDEDETLTDELDTLIELSRLPSSVKNLIPGKLLNSLDIFSRRLNIPVEVSVAVLLPIVASCLKTNTQVFIDTGTEHFVPSILWMMLIAETGSAKSVIFRILMKPLVKMQLEMDEKYNREIEQYEIELRQYEKTSKEERGCAPKQPFPRELYFQDFTIEALAESISNHPDFGSLVASDEFSGTMNSLNQYKSRGKGSDREKLLSLYDGSHLKSNRKGSGNSKKRVSIPRTSISMIGNIQPQIFFRLFKPQDAVDGFEARFYLVNLPLAKMPPPSDGKCDLSPMLYSLYSKLREFQPKTYFFSPTAKKLWTKWHLWTEDTRMQEFNPRIRAIFPKSRERAARFALVVHCLQAAFKGEIPSDEISEETLQAAIQYVKWTIGQARVIYAQVGEIQHPEASKIFSYIERFKNHGWITRRETSRWYAKKPCLTKEEATNFMQSVVALGYAVGNGKTGKAFKIKIIPQPEMNSLGTADSTDKPPESRRCQGLGSTDNVTDSALTAPDNPQDNKAENYQAETINPESGRHCQQDVSTFVSSENPLDTNGSNPVVSSVSSDLDKARTLQPGDKVRKRHQRGWVGTVETVIDDGTANVLWVGDSLASTVRLEDLELEPTKQ